MVKKVKNFFGENYFRGKAPPLTSSIKCNVFENYWIEEHDEDITLPEIDNYYFRNDLNTAPHHVYENFTLGENISVKATLPRGKYIHWDYSGIKKIFNPVEDTPSIFIEFATLGSQDNLKKKSILNFVNKYGVLKTHENRGFDVKYGFPYNQYPVEAFKSYAYEAHFIFKLYTLLKQDKKKLELRNHLLQIDKYIPGGFELFQEIVDYNKLLFRWWKQFSEHIKKELIKYFPREKTADVKGVEVFPIGEEENLKYDARRIPLIPILGFEDISFWEHLFEEVPIEAVIEAAGKFISAVTNLRIRDDIFFFSTVDTEGQSRLFKHHWSSPSLLTIMWFLFYLEITGQMTQKYKICKFCAEPIFPEKGEEKVHGRRKFHEGCRQKYSQYAKKQIQTMHKAGKGIAEINQHFTDITEDTIKKWIAAAEDNKEE